MPIHVTAVIDSHAEIDATADIGAYVTISGRAVIAAGTRVAPHVNIIGPIQIGEHCEIHSLACLGDTPQDRAYQGGESGCVIGPRTIVREGVTVHRGTAPGSTTLIGADCMFMANAHVGHNCVVGDGVTMVNGAVLAGHVHVGPRAFLSGYAGVHQFVRIGELAMLGGVTKVVMDVPPFFTVGRDGTCESVNIVGLRRAGYPPADRDELRRAFKLLYRSGKPFGAAKAELSASVTTEAGRRLVAFLQQPSRRGVVSGRARGGDRDEDCDFA